MVCIYECDDDAVGESRCDGCVWVWFDQDKVLLWSFLVDNACQLLVSIVSELSHSAATASDVCITHHTHFDQLTRSTVGTYCGGSPTAVQAWRPFPLLHVTCSMGSHNVTCYSTQLNTPRLNPSQYSIYLPHRDGRLSWSRCLHYVPAGNQIWPLDRKSDALTTVPPRLCCTVPCDAVLCHALLCCVPYRTVPYFILCYCVGRWQRM